VLVLSKFTAAHKHNGVEVVVGVARVEEGARKLHMLFESYADDLARQPFSGLVRMLVDRPAVKGLVGIHIQLNRVSDVVAAEPLNAVSGLGVIQLEGDVGVHNSLTTLQAGHSVEVVFDFLPRSLVKAIAAQHFERPLI